jgi:hypothetical protein
VGNSIYTLFRALAGLEAGRWCRTCHEPIAPRDGFGLSEGVCRACRHAFV